MFQRFSPIIIIFISLFLINGCGEKTMKDTKVPPGHAKESGVIKSILPVADSGIEGDPCSIAPCVASVKVESVSYGAGFSPFPKNGEIKMKFQYTLEKTNKELFPNLEESFPGLNVGDEFIAIAAYIESVDQSAPKYIVYQYEKK